MPLFQRGVKKGVFWGIFGDIVKLHVEKTPIFGIFGLFEVNKIAMFQ